MADFSGTKRRQWLVGQVANQKAWIEEHGGDLAGYVAHYGDPGQARCYGHGGTAIYMADAAKLVDLEAKLAKANAKAAQVVAVAGLTPDLDKDLSGVWVHLIEAVRGLAIIGTGFDDPDLRRAEHLAQDAQKAVAVALGRIRQRGLKYPD